MKQVKKLLCLILALVLVLALVSCASAEDEDSDADNEGTQSDDTNTGLDTSGEKNNAALDTDNTVDYSDKYIAITVGWANSSFGDISPFGVAGSAKINYLQIIYETLAVQTEVGQALEDMQLVLAKSFTRVDDLTLEYEIYDYITDSEGNSITAEDVAWSFNTAKELGNLNSVSCLDSAEVTGENTVRIYLSSCAVGDVETMIQAVPIVSQAAYEETGDGMTTTVIATGPYIMSEMVAGSTMKLIKNEDYWQTDDDARSPYSVQNVDEINYQVIAENNQMVIAMQTGEIVTTNSTKAAFISSFVDDSGKGIDGYVVELLPSTKCWTLLFNGSEGPTSDNADLRKAICYAINEADMINVGQKGVANTTYDVASIECADFVESWLDEDYFGYNIETAKEYLDASGYDASDLHLRILSANNDSDKLISQLIQGALDELGIESEIIAYDTALYNTAKNSGEGWDICTDKPMGDYVITTYTTQLSSSVAGSTVTRNFFDDATLTSLLDAASAVGGDTEENLQALHEYMMDVAYIYSFSSSNDFIVANSDIVESVAYLNYGGHNVLPSGFTFTEEFLESCPSK